MHLLWCSCLRDTSLTVYAYKHISLREAKVKMIYKYLITGVQIISPSKGIHINSSEGREQ